MADDQDEDLAGGDISFDLTIHKRDNDWDYPGEGDEEMELKVDYKDPTTKPLQFSLVSDKLKSMFSRDEYDVQGGEEDDFGNVKEENKFADIASRIVELNRENKRSGVMLGSGGYGEDDEEDIEDDEEGYFLKDKPTEEGEESSEESEESEEEESSSDEE